MNKILLEADLFTVNLTKLTNKKIKQNAEKTSKNVDETSKDGNTSTDTENINWNQELNRREKVNNALSKDARESTFEVEQKFWLDFFKSLDKERVTLFNNLGDLFKKDIRALGFDINTNPILAFLCVPYVKTNLLDTKKINKSTYDVLHNAYAKGYLSKYSLNKFADYNIIYCSDLYNKSTTDMERLLELQAQFLNPTKQTHPDAIVQLNRVTFLYSPQHDTAKKLRVDDPKVKVFSPSEVEKTIKRLIKIDKEKKEKENKAASTGQMKKKEKNKSTSSTAKEVEDFKGSIDTPAEGKFVLDFFCVTTKDTDVYNEAAAALDKPCYKGITAESKISLDSDIVKSVKALNFTNQDKLDIIQYLQEEDWKIL